MRYKAWFSLSCCALSLWRSDLSRESAGPNLVPEKGPSGAHNSRLSGPILLNLLISLSFIPAYNILENENDRTILKKKRCGPYI